MRPASLARQRLPRPGVARRVSPNPIVAVAFATVTLLTGCHAPPPVIPVGSGSLLDRGTTDAGLGPRGLALIDVGVIDGRGAGPLFHQVVVIRNGRIAALYPLAETRDLGGAQAVRLPGFFVIPGLIDSHVHATLPFTTRALQDEVLGKMFRGGITTVRDMAGDAGARGACGRIEQLRHALSRIFTPRSSPARADFGDNRVARRARSERRRPCSGR